MTSKFFPGNERIFQSFFYTDPKSNHDAQIRDYRGYKVELRGENCARDGAPGPREAWEFTREWMGKYLTTRWLAPLPREKITVNLYTARDLKFFRPFE